MAYLHALGYNAAYASLTPLVPQLRTDATVQPVQRSYGLSGVIHHQGGYIDLLYSAFGDTVEVQTLYAQVGLTNALQAQGTWFLPDDAYVWRLYNGIVARPEQGADIRRNNYFIRDVTIRVIRLVEIENDAAASLTLGAATVVGTGTVV